MRVLETVEQLREARRELAAKSLGFVPTMGYLTPGTSRSSGGRGRRMTSSR